MWPNGANSSKSAIFTWKRGGGQRWTYVHLWKGLPLFNLSSKPEKNDGASYLQLPDLTVREQRFILEN